MREVTHVERVLILMIDAAYFFSLSPRFARSRVTFYLRSNAGDAGTLRGAGLRLDVHVKF